MWILGFIYCLGSCLFFAAAGTVRSDDQDPQDLSLMYKITLNGFQVIKYSFLLSSFFEEVTEPGIESMYHVVLL